MSSMRNRAQLIGRLGAKAEIKRFEDGKVKATFRLATNDFYKNAKGETIEETTWHNIVAWGGIAENIEKYTDKGSKIGLEGKIVNHTFEGKDGTKKYISEVLTNHIELMGNAPSTE